MADEDATSRTLILLSLLQSRRDWTGARLSERLGVSGRTLRRDIERLRALGYAVDAERGRDGGYRLVAGADLPPLLLTSEETIAMALALGSAAAIAPVDGLAGAAASALAKLEPVIPDRLRSRVRALRTATRVAATPRDAIVDPELLALLAIAVRDTCSVRLSYRAASGDTSVRRIDPHALVPHRGHWYVVAWDHAAGDWRTLRADRIEKADDLRVTFDPHPIPGNDAAALVAARLQETPLHRATVTIAAPLAEVTGYLKGYARDLHPAADGVTIWTLEAQRVETLVGALVWLPWSYRVEGSPELTSLLESLSTRWSTARSRIPTDRSIG